MESPTKCWCEQYSWNLFGYKTTPSHFESLGKCHNNEIWGGGVFLLIGTSILSGLKEFILLKILSQFDMSQK